MSVVPPDSGGSGLPLISVCVCTYLRPAGLERLLNSLLGMVSETPDFEVIVVDNDSNESGRHIVTGRIAACTRPGTDIRYFVEPVQNIARARNLCLQKARGEWVAFVDDDETVDPDWLVELYRQLRASSASGGGVGGVMGIVVSDFDQAVPDWCVVGRFFDKWDWEQGQSLHWWQLSTANVLLSTEALASVASEKPGHAPVVFDSAYGVTGGEDSDLFVRLINRGYRFVAAPAALVHEAVPLQRSCFSWLASRWVRNGVIATRMECAECSFAERALLSVRWLVSALYYLLSGLIWLPIDRVRSYRDLFRVFEHIGKIRGWFQWRARNYGTIPPAVSVERGGTL